MSNYDIFILHHSNTITYNNNNNNTQRNIFFIFVLIQQNNITDSDGRYSSVVRLNSHSFVLYCEYDIKSSRRLNLV